MNNFHKKTLKQISLWLWTATVFPLTALAGLFFLKFIGAETLYTISLMIGATVMFSAAVIWWCWAIYTIAGITKSLDKTIDKFNDVKSDIVDIKKTVKDQSVL